MIPKHIWTYWHDPSNMPPMITKCIETWRDHNPDHVITILNPDTVPNKPLMNQIKHLPHARIADYVRLDVLTKLGGIWIDASCICTESFQWIHDRHRATNCEMIAFYHWTTTNPQQPIIENYFIACVPGSAFVRDWNNELKRVLTYPNEHAYITDVKKLNINMQNLEQMLPYLLPYLCASVVQQMPLANYNLELSDSFRGPYKWMKKHNWKEAHSLHDLCLDSEMQTPLIKIHNGVRKHIERNGISNTCSHSSVHASVRHVLQPFVRKTP